MGFPRPKLPRNPQHIMSTPATTEPDEQAVNPWVKRLAMGLPLGLLTLGVGSMLYTELQAPEDKFDEHEQKRIEAAAFNRRPIDTKFLSFATETLTQKIGERRGDNETARKGLESSALWMQGLLRGGNFGYRVTRHTSDVAEIGNINTLMADLLGGKNRKDWVVLAADYTAEDGASQAEAGGLAVLLSVARALAGDPQDRGVRFVGLASDVGPTVDGSTPTARFAQSLQEQSHNIVTVVVLEDLAKSSAAPRVTVSGAEADRFRVDQVAAALRGESELPVEVVIGEGREAAGAFEAAGLATVSVRAQGMSEASFLELALGVERVVKLLANP